jgi:hypothetical protein
MQGNCQVECKDLKSSAIFLSLADLEGETFSELSQNLT